MVNQHAESLPSGTSEAASLALQDGKILLRRSVPINAQRLLERCFGNLEFANVLLDELESTVAQRLTEIQQYASHRDATLISDQSHSLKGAAGVLCAEQIEQAASDLERAARSQDASQISLCITHLSHEMKQCLEFLPELRRSMERK